MNAKELIAQCHALGVTLAMADNNRLRIHPPGMLPVELMRLLREQKVAVMNLLTPPPQRGCYTCQRRTFWQQADSYKWICATCHPAPRPALVQAFHETVEPALPWLGITVRPWKGEG